MQVPRTSPPSLTCFCRAQLRSLFWKEQSESNGLEAVKCHRPRGNKNLLGEFILPQNQEAPRGCGTSGWDLCFLCPSSQSPQSC